MTEGRRRDRAHNHHRNRDRWAALLIVALAVVAGGLAAHFGTTQPWEHPAGGTTTQSVHVQSGP